MTDNELPLVDLLAKLMDETTPLPASLIYRLSNPSGDDLTLLANIWHEIPLERRQLLLSRVVEASETDSLSDYTATALFALDDDDPDVRVMAIGALWASDDVAVMHRLIQLLETDVSTDVRAASASALGHFVYLAEMDDLERSAAGDLEAALLHASSNKDLGVEVNRRALEAIAYSSRPDVIPLIQSAANSEYVLLRASAVFAMGRNGEDLWIPEILNALDDPDPEISFEAVRSCGELAIPDAVERLIALTESGDRDIKEMAIWSLGEIGGQEALAALHSLADHETNEDFSESIEDAINVASLMLGTLGVHFLPEEQGDGLELLDELEVFEDDLDTRVSDAPDE